MYLIIPENKKVSYKYEDVKTVRIAQKLLVK